MALVWVFRTSPPSTGPTYRSSYTHLRVRESLCSLLLSHTQTARYEKLAEAFGGKGYYVTRPEEIEPAMRDALSQKCPTIVNIMIDTEVCTSNSAFLPPSSCWREQAKRKPQEHPFEMTKLPGKTKSAL